MREITVNYEGQCVRCGEMLQVGVKAMYEKSMGVFCMGHEPKDVEEIRAFRQAKADRKADRLEGWAGKRREKIHEVWAEWDKHHDDDAFLYQPGHIPERTRLIKRTDRAMESLQVAKRMEKRAGNIRHVRVAGDAERKRQELRDATHEQLKVGMKVNTVIYGLLEINKINKITVTCDSGHEPLTKFGSRYLSIDISFLKGFVDEHGTTHKFSAIGSIGSHVKALHDMELDNGFIVPEGTAGELVSFTEGDEIPLISFDGVDQLVPVEEEDEVKRVNVQDLKPIENNKIEQNQTQTVEQTKGKPNAQKGSLIVITGNSKNDLEVIGNNNAWSYRFRNEFLPPVWSVELPGKGIAMACAVSEIEAFADAGMTWAQELKQSIPNYDEHKKAWNDYIKQQVSLYQPESESKGRGW